ncbi:MAG: acetylglutamate kinase [Alphaproteobacteria bacterium]|nr:acetylglutamate kinase [Alphaproteobacteria bacterium]
MAEADKKGDSDRKKSSARRWEWFAKAGLLSEALPFMRHHAGSTFVIKYGGHAMGDDGLGSLFASDMVLLKMVGINPIVVHGGGPQIGQMLDRLQIKSRFIDGLRVTDAAAMEVVEMVLAGTINKQIVSSIGRAGGMAIGISGKDGSLVQARKLVRSVRDPSTGKEATVEFGFVGEPTKVNPTVLQMCAASNVIPVVAPIGIGPEGESYNINADTVAGFIAGAVNAKRLFLLTDVAGVMDGSGEVVHQMTAADARQLIATKVATGGMIPKLETCIDAVERGVEGAVILDGRMPHVMLLELFTEAGIGTMISQRGDVAKPRFPKLGKMPEPPPPGDEG